MFNLILNAIKGLFGNKKCSCCNANIAVAYEHGIPTCNECLPHQENCPSLKTKNYKDCSNECWCERYIDI